MATNDNLGFNSFSNDGSFFEMFRKHQEEKKKPEGPSTAPENVIQPLKTAKPVVMKLSSLKKKKNPFLAQPVGTKIKAFSHGEASDEEDEDNSKAGEGKQLFSYF